ncbi:hypothetical protein BraRD5C2_28200 [Bradyrhizobium sp. RD5-C2]|nr:hypothetical protein BraRD5C2_28200 [Bradyrhizobium sp. RD5-C2]
MLEKHHRGASATRHICSPRHEGATRLVNDHLVDDRLITAKLDEAGLPGNAKPPALLRREAIGRLVVGLQFEHPLAIQRDAVRDRPPLEAADTARAERDVGAVAGRQAHEHDISDCRFERRRKADYVAVAIGQERDRKRVRHVAVRHLGRFERLKVTVHQSRKQAAPGPMQDALQLPNRHHAVSRVFIIAGVGRKLVRRVCVGAAALLPHALVDLDLLKGFDTPLPETLAPFDRLAAAQPVDDLQGQRPRHLVRTAIGEDGNADAEIR